jgi:hypothetical protein
MPPDEDHVFNFKQFIRKIDGKTAIKFTLSQDFGFNNPDWIRVTAYHPIIVAALTFFKRASDVSNSTFALKLNKGKTERLSTLINGTYYLATYSLLTKRSKYGITNEFNQLIPVVYRVVDSEVSTELEVTETFLGECQLYGEDHFDSVSIDQSVISDLRISLNEAISAIELDILNGERSRLNTHMDQKRKRVNELYDIRTQRQETIVEQTRRNAQFHPLLDEREKARRILPLQESNLEKLERERSEALSRIQSASISSEFPKLLSLNKVEVY